MTPEEKALLERTAKLAEENNKILHKLVSSARWNTFWRWVYWIVIIGTAIGAFWFLQPYLNVINSDWSSISSAFQSYKNPN